MELIIIRDGREVGRLRLSEGIFSIGRGLHNTISLDDQGISRRHARIRVEGARVIAQDLASANGTFLKGRPIAEAELKDGDALQIGPFAIRIVQDDEDFIDHQLDRTVTRVTLQDLQQQAPVEAPRRAEMPTQILVLPERERAPEASPQEEFLSWSQQEVTVAAPSRSATTTSPARSAAEAAEGRQGATELGPDEHSDWMEPHDLFGLRDDDSWPDQAAASAAPDSPGASPGAGVNGTAYHGISGPLHDTDRSGALSNVTRDTSALEPRSNGAAAQIHALDDDQEEDEQNELEVGLEAPDAALHRRSREDDPEVTPRLPNTLNLAETAVRSAGTAGQRGQNGGANRPPTVDENAPHLVVRVGQAVQDCYELSQGTAFLGRAEEMEIVLLDPNASRRHAAIHWEDDGYILRDLWSLNGIRVNGERVTAARLHSGDRIQIGDTVLEFIWREEQMDEPDHTVTLVPPAPAAAAPAPPPPVVRSASRSVLASPSLWIVLGVAVIAVGVLSLSRTRSVSPPPLVALPASPVLPDELAKHLREADALLQRGAYDGALPVAQAVQAAAPESTAARRLVQEIYEMKALSEIGGGLPQRNDRESLPEVAVASASAPAVGGSPADAKPAERANPVASSLPSAERSPLPQAAVASSSGAGGTSSTPVRRASQAAPPERSAATPERLTDEGRRSKKSAEAPSVAGNGRTELDRRVLKSYQQGLAERKRGRYLEAIRSYEHALGEDPYKESEFYYQIEDEVQAVRNLLHEQARPLVSEALTLIEQERWTDARRRLVDAVARDPYNTLAATRLTQVDAELATQAGRLMVKAQMKEEAGETEEAVRLYRQVLSLIPNPSNIQYQRAARSLEKLKKEKQ